MDNSSYLMLQFDIVEWYIDHQFLVWAITIILPFVYVFFIPVFLCALVHFCAIYLQMYRYYFKANGLKFTRQSWRGAHVMLAHFWETHGRLWYGHEVEGLENIPSDGPALIVFYHGAMPVDWYYLLAQVILHKNRLIRAVGDKFLFKLPGWEALLDAFQVYTGTVDGCAGILQEGHLLAIAPGGVREAQFADENYPVMWGKRVGFAKVAREGKAPIIPVFTRNIREAFSTVTVGRSWLRKIYEKTRIPVVPIYGGFPVKLKTFIGKPIPHDSCATPEELAQKTVQAMEELITRHQQPPGSVLRAMAERVFDKTKKKCP